MLEKKMSKHMKFKTFCQFLSIINTNAPKQMKLPKLYMKKMMTNGLIKCNGTLQTLPLLINRNFMKTFQKNNYNFLANKEKNLMMIFKYLIIKIMITILIIICQLNPLIIEEQRVNKVREGP